nr:unnamed protein product [Spirometra erinaceieuropaei]
MDLHQEKNGISYRPRFPLPDELLALDRMETVCQYCGVSYLILSEFKSMEEKVFELSKNLDEMKEKEEHFLRMRTDFERVKSENLLCRDEIERLTEKTENLIKINHDLDSELKIVSDHVITKETEVTTLSSRINTLLDSEKTKRLQLIDLISEVRNLKRVAHSYVSDAKSLNLEREMQPFVCYTNKLLLEAGQRIKHLNGSFLQAKDKLSEMTKAHETERSRRIAETTKLNDQIAKSTRKLAELQGVLDAKEKEFSSEVHSVNSRAQELEERLLDTIRHNGEHEAELKNKIAELHRANSELSDREMSHLAEIESLKSQLAEAKVENEKQRTDDSVVLKELRLEVANLRDDRDRVIADLKNTFTLIQEMRQLCSFFSLQHAQIREEVISESQRALGALEQVINKCRGSNGCEKIYEELLAYEKGRTNALLRQAEELRRQIKDLKADQQSQEVPRTEADDSARQLTASLAEVQHDLENKTAECLRLRMDCDTLKENYEKLQALGAASSNADFTAQIEKRDSEIKRLRDVVTRECQERDALTAALEDALSRLQVTEGGTKESGSDDVGGGGGCCTSSRSAGGSSVGGGSTRQQPGGPPSTRLNRPTRGRGAPRSVSRLPAAPAEKVTQKTTAYTEWGSLAPKSVIATKRRLAALFAANTTTK